MKNFIVSILCAALCIGAAQSATKPKKEKKAPEPTAEAAPADAPAAEAPPAEG